MSRATTPSTPESTPPGLGHGFRRSLPTPTRMRRPSDSPSSDSSHPTENVETLFTTPTAKVVSFETPANARSPSVSMGAASSGDAPSGTLAWGTPTERTMAAGPLRIYRVPGSVSFLHSGSLLHHLLRRSQCWCVDGQSIFVLRKRPNAYYRIEIPFENGEDKERVEAFRAALDKVLQYEKTPCPFKPGYTEDPPAAPETPAKITRRSTQRAKRWIKDKVWAREDGERQTTSGEDDGDRQVVEMSDGSAFSTSEEDDMHATSATDVKERTGERTPGNSSPPLTAKRVEQLLSPIEHRITKSKIPSQSRSSPELSSEGRTDPTENESHAEDVSSADEACNIEEARVEKDAQEDHPYHDVDTKDIEQTKLDSKAEGSPVKSEISSDVHQHSIEKAQSTKEAEAAEESQAISESSLSGEASTTSEPMLSKGSQTTELLPDTEVFEAEEEHQPNSPVVSFDGVHLNGRRDSATVSASDSGDDDSHATSVPFLERAPTTFDDTESIASTMDSFYSLSETNSVSTAAPYMDALSLLDEPQPFEYEPGQQHVKHHKRGASELTVTPTTMHGAPLRSPGMLSEDGRTISTPSTPTLMSDSEDHVDMSLPDAVTPPDTIRLRRLPATSHPRDGSPTPQTSNRVARQPSASRRSLTISLIQKTYAILMSPPGDLVTLMLGIAARIAAGARDLGPFGIGRPKDRMACTWESSGDEEDDWGEDDYGIPLRGVDSNTARKANGEASSDRQ